MLSLNSIFLLNWEMMLNLPSLWGFMLGKVINICTNIKFHNNFEFNANMCIINRRTDFAEFARWWIMRQDGGGEDDKIIYMCRIIYDHTIGKDHET